MERLQAKLRERGDTANEEKLSLLKSVLQSPLFNQILNLQASLPQSRDQVGWYHLQGKEEMPIRLCQILLSDNTLNSLQNRRQTVKRSKIFLVT